jgi:hypothetical protein
MPRRSAMSQTKVYKYSHIDLDLKFAFDLELDLAPVDFDLELDLAPMNSAAQGRGGKIPPMVLCAELPFEH